jgi:hypothetical protein
LGGLTAVRAGWYLEEVMTVTEGLPGGDGNRVMMVEGRMLKPEDRIHDLLDILKDSPGFSTEGQQVGRSGPEKIYDLVDVVERKPKMAFVDAGLRDEIMKRAAEIAEKVAREIIPDIAERVIREEIEKLKKGI